jgi:hypothetical protein
MIMSANSDQEVDTVIQALKKFVFDSNVNVEFFKLDLFCFSFRYSSDKQKVTDYHFGSPVMRLLYIHNKTDLAIQLFMDEVNLYGNKRNEFIHQSFHRFCFRV